MPLKSPKHETNVAPSPESARDIAGPEDLAQEHPGAILQRARDKGGSFNDRDVLRLQSTIGNRATRRLMAPSHTPSAQRKAAVPSGGGAASGSAVQFSLGEPSRPKKPAGAPLGGVAHSFLAGDASSGAVRGLADGGVRGSGGPLPHAARIQESFGSFDVSGISAHAGPGAQSANASLGSNAYAIGEKVALSAPDLWTEAHEATHVLQQRAGVSVSGGVGRPGDTYERQAHEVADRVVSGQSVEGLLASSLGPPSASGQPSGGAPAVQMDIAMNVEKGDWYLKKGKYYQVVDIDYPNSFAVDAILQLANTDKQVRVRLGTKDAKKFEPCVGPSKGDEELISKEKQPNKLQKAKSSFMTSKNNLLSNKKEEVFNSDEEFDQKAFEERFWSLMQAHLPKRGAQRMKKLKQASDLLSAASDTMNFGLENAADMGIQHVKKKKGQRVNLNEILPQSYLGKAMEMTGVGIRILGDSLETSIPVLGGAAAMPFTFVGTAMESKGQGKSFTESIAKGAASGGTTLLVGCIPGYGQGAGFVGMSSDLAKLGANAQKGSNLEALIRLYALQEYVDEMHQIATEEEVDIYKVTGFAKFEQDLDRKIDEFTAKVQKKQNQGKEKMMKQQTISNWDLSSLVEDDNEDDNEDDKGPKYQDFLFQ